MLCPALYADWIGSASPCRYKCVVIRLATLFSITLDKKGKLDQEERLSKVYAIFVFSQCSFQFLLVFFVNFSWKHANYVLILKIIYFSLICCYVLRRKIWMKSHDLHNWAEIYMFLKISFLQCLLRCVPIPTAKLSYM